MDEVLIQFETAKLAKKVGFNLEQPNFYHSHGYLNKDDNCFFVPRFEAPTQALLQKYLREIHDIDITIHRSFSMMKSYHYTVISHNNYEYELQQQVVQNRSYEQALEAGLQEGLKLIEI